MLKKLSTKRNEIAILLFTILFLSVCFYFAKPLFETNDDPIMIRILSGQYGNETSWNPIFMSPILGRVIAGLYQIQPSFPWYSAILYFFLLCGLLIGLKIIINQINDKMKQWTAVICFLGLYMVYMYQAELYFLQPYNMVHDILICFHS